MDVFKLLGKIVLDGVEAAKKDLDGVSDKAEASESRLTGAFKKIGAAVVTYFATDKIVDFGRACVEMSATVSAEESAFEQIMGDYSLAAQEKMGEVAEAVGMVETRLTPYMTSMTAKFKGLGYDIEEATNYAQTGLLLAADAAAFWDKSLDEAMSHLNSFVNGSYEGGEAIGLFANDTQMAAYAIEQGLVSEAKEWSALDEAIKQATRLEYAQNMMEQSGAVGQAAKESDQYANVMANVSEKWEQVQAKIGEPLLQNTVLPVVSALEEKMGMLEPVLTNIATAAGNAVPLVVGLIDKLMPVIEYVGEIVAVGITKVVEGINNGIPVIQNFGSYFSDNLLPIISSFVEYAQDKLLSIFENVKSIIENNTEKINFLKDAFSNAVEIIADFGEYLLDFIEWMTGSSEGADKLRTVIEASAVAFATYKVTMLAFNSAVKIGTTLVNAYRKAQQLLNATNPFGWVALAVSGMAALATIMYEEKKSTILPEYREMAETAEEMQETLKNIKDENKEISTAVSNEYDGYRELAGELDTLIGKNGEIKEHCETRVKQIIEQLNPALDTSLEIVDGQLQGYKDINTELDNIITKKQVEALLEQGMENYNEIKAAHSTSTHNRFKAESDIEELETELAAIEEARVRFNEGEDWNVEGYSDMSMDDALDRIPEILTNLEELRNTVEEETENIEGFNLQLSTFEGLMNASTENNLGAMKRYTQIYTYEMLTAGNASLAELTEQHTSFAEMYDQMVEARANGDTSITDDMLEQAKQRENIALDEKKKQEKIAYDTARSSASAYNSGMTSKTGEISATAKSISNTTVAGLKSGDAESAGRQVLSRFGEGALSAAHTYFGQIINTVESYVSYLSGLGGHSSVYANSPHDVEIIRSKIPPKTATGGIVTRAQTRLVGEDGAEAIIPLEHNTEWIDKVASRMSGSTSNSVVAEKLDEVISLLKNQKIYLDSGQLVGGIAGKMDRKLGSMARLKGRG